MLLVLDDAPSVIGMTELATAAEHSWQNPFEDAYYGDTTLRIATNAPVRLVEMADICVTGSEALIFSAPHTLLRLCTSQDRHPVRKMRHPLRCLALRIPEPVFLLGGRAPGNRGHFLVEHLPRLIAAQKALGNALPRKVLVTPGHASWQRDYLNQFGFGDLEVVEGSPGTTWCKHAWTVPNLSSTGSAELCPPHLYQDLLSRLNLPKRSSAPRSAIFLTRKDAPSRQMRNEDTIFSIAKRFVPDLQRVSLARLNISQQIELFAGAHTIIGAHSQAFRCVLYARDALVVQLVPGERSERNEYRFWADNYSLLATLQKNRALSLYATDAHSGSQSFDYPEDRFATELPKVLSLSASQSPQ